MFECQIALEREELAEYPDEEAEALALIYTARGMDPTQARAMAQDLVKVPERAGGVSARRTRAQSGGPRLAVRSRLRLVRGVEYGAALPLVPFLLSMPMPGPPSWLPAAR